MTNELPDVRSIEDILPLSPMQQGMLFHSLLDEKSGIYFEQLSTKIEGEFDVKAFQKAWQEVINRNSMLRTSFVWEDVDEPLQVIHKKVEAPFQFEDWSTLSPSEQEDKFDLYLQDDRANLFDLNTPPLMRFGLIKLAQKPTDLSGAIITSSLTGGPSRSFSGKSLPIMKVFGMAIPLTFNHRASIAILLHGYNSNREPMPNCSGVIISRASHHRRL